jgi:hypothetical protein
MSMPRSAMSRRTVLTAAAAAPVLLSVPAAAKSGPVMLKVGDRLKNFGLLKPGVHQYLRSRETSDMHLAQQIWRREVRFETVDGAPKMRIVQRWTGTGETPSKVEMDSLFEPMTWRPSSHIRITTTKSAGRKVEGFMFSEARITGLADLADNTRTDFNVPSNEPMYNFETDVEMLGTLPLAQGYAVSIPFYHPGGGEPARYLWTVTGSEKMPGPDGRAIDCWILETDYNEAGSKPARFWFAKGTAQLVRQESTGPDGAMFRKTLLW